MNWGLIFSIITALGIFEFVKKIVNFGLENNFLRKNLEIREIADRALKYSVWLKERNFEEPLSSDARSQLNLDICKIEEFDEELAENLMRLINNPLMMGFLYKDKNGGERHRQLINMLHKELSDKNRALNRKLNHLRYKPIIDWSRFVRFCKKQSAGS